MVGTFPLNVQAGSPQYTLVTQVTPTPNGTATIKIDTYDTRPTDNAYYTIQNEDGSIWCTFYADSWSPESDGNYSTQGIITSANTMGVIPEGSICWCIWCYEYYDSLVTPISTINNEISSINNNISIINNEIDTLTPKVNNSVVSATKIGDSTLRLTRNNGTTVDISFHKGVNVRNVNLTSYTNITANTNEIVVITGSFSSSALNNYTLTISGLGYLELEYDLFTGSHKEFVMSEISGPKSYTNISGTVFVTGLLYNGASLIRTR